MWGDRVIVLRLAVVNGLVYLVTLWMIGASFWEGVLIAASVAAFSVVGNVPRYIAWGGFVLIVVAIGDALGLKPQVNEIYDLLIESAS